MAIKSNLTDYKLAERVGEYVATTGSDESGGRGRVNILASREPWPSARAGTRPGLRGSCQEADEELSRKHTSAFFLNYVGLVYSFVLMVRNVELHILEKINGIWNNHIICNQLQRRHD